MLHKKHHKIKRQPPLKGGRHRMSFGMHPYDALMVEDAARRFRVSKSWAAALYFSEATGNEEQETFLPMPKSGVRPKLIDKMSGRKNGRKR